MDSQITILSHGFNKSQRDMAYLSYALNDHGINNIAVNVPIRFRSLEDCLEALRLQINSIVKNYTNVNFVGHSAGGLLIRSYINKYNPQNIRRCVFIATPHMGSRLAKISGYIPFYNRVFKPLKNLQPQAENGYLLANGDIEIGVIAGKNNNTILGKMFLPPESDGRVEIYSAASADAKDMIVLPYGHKEIHHKDETLKQVKHFLSQGCFSESVHL